MARAGFTLRDAQGYQVALFPSQQVAISQGAGGTYSHENTLNTDNACYSNKRDIYAPFDMEVVANYTGAGYGIVIFWSLRQVRFADGSLGYGTVVMMHDNQSYRWGVGSTYIQGQHCYTEGKADPSGATTGIHVHYEVSKRHTTRRIPSGGSWGFSQIEGAVRIDSFFVIDGCEYISEIPENWTNSQRTYFTYYENAVPDPVEVTSALTIDGSGVSVLYINVGGWSNYDIDFYELYLNGVLKDTVRIGTTFFNRTHRVERRDLPNHSNFLAKVVVYSKGEFSVTEKIGYNEYEGDRPPSLNGDIIPLYMLDIIKGGYNGKS